MTDDQKQIAALKETLYSLIAWMAQSANSPISRTEAAMLLQKLDGESGATPNKETT